MTPIFLGEGTDEQKKDQRYLWSRMDYWQEAAQRARKDAFRSNNYKQVVLGYQMLIEGSARPCECGKYCLYNE